MAGLYYPTAYKKLLGYAASLPVLGEDGMDELEEHSRFIEFKALACKGCQSGWGHANSEKIETCMDQPKNCRRYPTNKGARGEKR